MKTADIISVFALVIIVFSVAFYFGVKSGARANIATKPIEDYLVQVVNDPNWITNYGVDLESRLVYNVALLNQVVNRQGNILKRLLSDPNI
jgi:hypothetical protein